MSEFIKARMLYFGHFGLFMLMGAGASWVLPTALFSEIPYFELHAPEGLCISTYMNVSVALGYLSLLLYLFLKSYEFATFRNEYAMPGLLIINCFFTFLTAALYNITVDKISLLLFICCFIGGSIGNLSSVIMNPFMTGFKKDFISAGRSGSSFATLLCSLVSLIQGPGTRDKFSASTYFVIFGFILILPMVAYFVIMKYQIGFVGASDENLYTTKMNVSNPIISKSTARDDVDGMELVEDGSNSPDGDRKVRSINDSNTNSSSGSNSNNNSCNDSSSLNKDNIIKNDSSSSTTNSKEDSRGGKDTDLTLEKTFEILNPDEIDRKFNVYLNGKLPAWLVTRFPFLPYTFPYMMTVAWINFNTWGLISALAPFAFKAVDPHYGPGAGLLASGYQAAGVALVLGDLSTTLFTFPLRISIVFYTITAAVVYAFSSMGGDNTSYSANHAEGVGTMLVIIFALNRFIEAHMITSVYRIIASTFPKQYRESASRSIGVSDQSSTIFGAIIAVSIVSTSLSCDSQ